ncbi:hypothetical protein LXM25_25835 [Dyadobacter sp. LJ53]|uniref:hypothetical protein n=1 Tax=Dyadobacter chenwenxiniae TaxID=2906456 RepID=UPI001F34CD00|nr:hypothetical protein [Dyadobacter chenwenxiniae]MCF0053519.1 hypothetical protein [Dyadobacter chenwenxiniae]
MSNRTQVSTGPKVVKEGKQPGKEASLFIEKKMSQMRETLKKYPIPFDTIKK